VVQLEFHCVWQGASLHVHKSRAKENDIWCWDSCWSETTVFSSGLRSASSFAGQNTDILRSVFQWSKVERWRLTETQQKCWHYASVFWLYRRTTTKHTGQWRDWCACNRRHCPRRQCHFSLSWYNILSVVAVAQFQVEINGHFLWTMNLSFLLYCYLFFVILFSTSTTSQPPGRQWWRRPFRPYSRWVDQLWTDNSLPPADLWRCAVNRDHSTAMLLRPLLAKQ